MLGASKCENVNSYTLNASAFTLDYNVHWQRQRAKGVGRFVPPYTNDTNCWMECVGRREIRAGVKA